MRTRAFGLDFDPSNLEAETDAGRHDACKHGAREIEVSDGRTQHSAAVTILQACSQHRMAQWLLAVCNQA